MSGFLITHCSYVAQRFGVAAAEALNVLGRPGAVELFDRARRKFLLANPVHGVEEGELLFRNPEIPFYVRAGWGVR